MFSATSQHAIRALMRLAQAPEGESILGRELAEWARIPPNFLSKIMWTLRKAGLVDATRGQGGGYRLAKNPEEITLMEIVRLFDGVNACPGCVLGEAHQCTDQEACPAHARWKVVRRAYLAFLAETTIAEIAWKTGRRSQSRRSFSS